MRRTNGNVPQRTTPQILRRVVVLVVPPVEELDLVGPIRDDLSVQFLADRVAMSVRNFERVFAQEVGMSPARYVRQLRVEAAQRMIERSEKGLEPIAMACGFSSAALMRRAFIRTSGATPGTRLKSE
jgi:transcriptional regulator GlxA family with amidase domain